MPARRRATRNSYGASGEVLISGMRELDHSTVAHDNRSGALAQRADARVSEALRRQLAKQPRDVFRVHGEAQLVVFSAGERKLAGTHTSERRQQRLGQRQLAV